MAGGCGAGSRGLKFKKRLEIFIAINNHAAIDLLPSVCLVHHHHPLQSSKPCTLGRNLMTSGPSTRRCGTCHYLAPANSHSASRNQTALADTTDALSRSKQHILWQGSALRHSGLRKKKIAQEYGQWKAVQVLGRIRCNVTGKATTPVMIQDAVAHKHRVPIAAKKGCGRGRAGEGTGGQAYRQLSFFPLCTRVLAN